MWVLTAPAWVVGDVRPPALSRSRSLRASFARSLALQVQEFEFQSGDQRMGHEFGDGHDGHVGTDLARRALARPDALTPTLAPRVARSLARFSIARNFNQALDKWDTSSVKTMYAMWVLTSPAVRSPAPTRSRPRSLRASLARSPGSTPPMPSTRTSIGGTRVR